jgi:hypothetical protein
LLTLDLFTHCGRGLGLALLAARLGAPLAQAQTPDSLATIGRRLERYGQQVPTEKLYGHLDQPVYTTRETLWFKLYAVDGTSHKPLVMSKVAYVEVLNSQHQPVLQTSVALRNATGHGSVVLPASLPSGRYTVRAYTSWMKNFSPDFYFQAPVTVINTFTASGNQAPRRTSPPDIQFFPEGGTLVQGLTSTVGFRVASPSGEGLAATGSVRNARGTTVATFSTLKFGLGSFSFTPATGAATYVAEVKLANGATYSAKLPAVAVRGYVLHLQEASPLQLRLNVATKNMGTEAAVLTLVGHSGKKVAVAQTAYANDHNETSFLITKQALLAGISHFTIFNSQRQPVGERLYFRRPAPLAVTATPTKNAYGLREKVALRLALPATTSAASLSVAVYQLDSLASAATPADISSVLNLTSDLKGTVENPTYYLQDSTQIGRAATDNLMLTHGWSRFRWEEVLAPQLPAFTYAPEANGPLVQGRVLTASGAPAADVMTYLSWPSRVPRFYNATSNAQGLVQFEVKDFYGPHKLILQTDWQRDSTYHFELLEPYSTRYASAPATSPLIFTSQLMGTLTQRHIQTQVQQAYFGQYQQYGLPPRDTMAVYGPPTEQYNLDEYTRFKVLEEVMREYVRGVAVHQNRGGVRFVVIDTPHHAVFQDDPLTLLDGVPLFDPKQLMAFDPLRIRKVEVVTNRYYYGSQTYSGIISYATYKQDLGGFRLNSHALLEAYEGLQGNRDFFAPRYDTPQQQQSSLADLRNLLYWNPEIKLKPGHDQSLDFFTSDQAGRYLVVVQALTENGQAGTTSTVLEVKPTL